MIRQFLLALSLVTLSVVAAYSQAGCPPNPPPYPYVNAIHTAPATVYAYTPFTVMAQVCNIPANTGYQLSVSITQQVNFSLSLQTRVTADANGIISIPVGAQFPASNYLVVINGTPLPFVGNQLFFPIDAPAPGPLNKLIGAYAFLFQGATTTPLPPGAATQAAITGTFISDGDGHITAGEADSNSPFGSSEQVPLTGSYNYDTTGNGTLTLNTSAGTQTFSLSVNPSDLAGPGGLTGAVFTTSSTGPFSGSGTLQPQSNPPNPSPYVYTSQVFSTLAGETPCEAAYCAAAGYRTLPLSASATMFFSNPNYTAYPTSFNITYDLTFGPSVITGLTESGTLSPADSYGRSVLTLTPPISNRSPARFAVYVIDNTYFSSMYMISLDPHDNAVLLSGELSNNGGGATLY